MRAMLLKHFFIVKIFCVPIELYLTLFWRYLQWVLPFLWVVSRVFSFDQAAIQFCIRIFLLVLCVSFRGFSNSTLILLLWFQAIQFYFVLLPFIAFIFRLSTVSCQFVVSNCQPSFNTKLWVWWIWDVRWIVRLIFIKQVVYFCWQGQYSFSSFLTINICCSHSLYSLISILLSFFVSLNSNAFPSSSNFLLAFQCSLCGFHLAHLSAVRSLIVVSDILRFG